MMLLMMPIRGGGRKRQTAFMAMPRRFFGDFLYSRASQLLARLGSVRLLQRMTDATNRLSEGELLQLLARRSGNISEEMYFSVIERKTANLFEIAAAGPAILAGQPAAEKALSEYGKRLGLAQLVDDCLDYEGGARARNDAPVILALAKMPEDARARMIWRSGDSNLPKLCAKRQSGACLIPARAGSGGGCFGIV